MISFPAATDDIRLASYEGEGYYIIFLTREICHIAYAIYHFLKFGIDKAHFKRYNELCDDRGEVILTLDLKRIFANAGACSPISYELDMSDMEQSGVYPLKKPVLIRGSVSNKADVVELSLEISYLYESTCDRCGIDTAREYKFELNRALAESLEGEESDTILTVPDMKLDVDELVYGEVFLSLPTKFLCKEGCKGICTLCGKDLTKAIAIAIKRKLIPAFLNWLNCLINN